MKVPLKWLKEYVDIDIGPKELADRLTMSGSKVETVEELGKEITNVVVGKILTLEKHPDADKLQVAKVDVGSKTIQIVTGAANVAVGDLIPIALDGSTLPGGHEIKAGKLRGVESFGMMCSINELGLTKNDYPEAVEDGIFILGRDIKLGADIKEVLGLNETVIEFEITPNRPDCLSILGIARETAVTLSKQLKNQQLGNDKKNAAEKAEVSININDNDLCARYVGRIVRNVKIGPSPEWMRQRLRDAGMRPINNLVDVTNYVMLELGYPMHAFDFEKIEGKQIIVRRAKEGEKITTLDGQDKALTKDMLVIADKSKPVAVAGVMGGENSEVSENTKTILLEAANFNGASIRLTAKALGFRTEASSRFEKGLDVESAVIAMNRAVELIEQIGAGEADKSFVDCYPTKWQPRTIKLRPDRINSFLGTNIDEQYMIDLLEKLEVKVNKKDMTVSIPSFREDIEGEADIAEEIARFYGYNNIKSTLCSGAATQGKKTLKQKIEDMCKTAMTAQGLSEIYTYSFVSPKSLEMINTPKDSELRKVVNIINPLSEDHKFMRTTTVSSMLEVLARNFSRRIEKAGFFDLGCVYMPNGSDKDLPYEKEVLTIGFYGDQDFYSLKGIIESLFAYLGIKSFEYERANDKAFHLGRSAQILLGGKNIGVFGEIDPDVLENYGIGARAYVAVIEVEPLVKNANMIPKYKQLPKYPAIQRDIAMVVKDEITVKQIEDVIKNNTGKLLEELNLFDFYRGNQIQEGHKSVAYSLSFRAADRTLVDQEVNNVMAKVVDELKGKLEAKLRE
jgi:phenylalanyl-tRNA synthetase beta chain